MTPQQRLNAVLTFVSERGDVSVREIADEIGVSLATARRDVTTLAAQRLVTRTHGGASLHGAAYDLPLQYKIPGQAAAKLAIAGAASALVGRGQSVGLNGGTTSTEVARTLARRPDLANGDETNLTIVTNALNIAYELAVRPNVKIVMTGGVARRQTFELVGPLVTGSLGQLSLDIAVLGVDGLDGLGITTHDEGEAQVSREFLRIAKRVVVVADSTKLGLAAFARISDLGAVDVLVTDAAVTGAHARALELAGVEVVVAQ